MKIIRGAKDENSCFVESNYGLLLFDTGATASQLMKSDITQELNITGAKTSNGLLGSVIQNIAVVDRLTVGEIVADNLKVSIDDNVGILGNDVLKNYSFIFDMKEDKITIVDRFTSDITCPIGKRNHIYVKIKIQDNEYWALIDTGASCSLLDKSLYFSVFGESKEMKNDKGEDWTGAAIETPMASIDCLTIGSIPFPSHEFALLEFEKFAIPFDYPIVAIIGASTLSQKRFWFNMVDGYIKID